MHSFVLLRPNNRVKLLTQSAQNWMCMGKWAIKIWTELFLKNKKAPDDRTFLPQWVPYHGPRIKTIEKSLLPPPLPSPELLPVLAL